MARYYDRRTRTFCSADPLAGDPSDPQSWNRYPYGRNNPIMITDPSGQNWFFSLLQDIGLVLAPFTGGAALPFAEGAGALNAFSNLANDQPPWGFNPGGRVSLGSSWNGTPIMQYPGLTAGIQGALGLPTMADVGPIFDATNARSSSPCTPSQRRFFDWLDNPTIRGMAKDLGTTPTIVFTLAAKEGGWTNEALNHNIPLSNPFGVNYIKNRRAAGNKEYTPLGGLSAAVKDWETSVTAAPYVYGKTNPTDFVDALLAHGYNANKKAYMSMFLKIAGSMPGHMTDCGVKP